MGLEATWSLVDIPADARDAAQAAARREGLSVGEWLTRRILRRFSELNAREQEESFVAIRNHVAELAARLDRFEGQSQAEPMREALKKLHDGLARLNEELVRTAGHSAIQVSQLATSFEALSGRVHEVRENDAESRSTFERRMAQLQEFVDGINLKHATETHAMVSRMDSVGETLAETRRLMVSDRSALEHLQDSLANADTRYAGSFRTLHEKFDSLSDRISAVGAATSGSSSAVNQRVDSLHLELKQFGTRHAEEKQLATAGFEKLRGRMDDLQGDVTGMCTALDRRVLLAQQALQSLDARHSEMSNSLARGMESVAAQMDMVRTESARNTTDLERRIGTLEASGASNPATDGRLAAVENLLSELANRTGAAESSISAVLPMVRTEFARNTTDMESRIAALEARDSSNPDSATDGRLVAVEHLLSELANRTGAAESSISAMLPKADAIEERFEQLNAKFDSQIQTERNTIDQLRTEIFEQTLGALGEKLEAESGKQQAAIAELKHVLIGELSQAFDERADAEDRKQQDAIGQLQSAFATALHSLGETFESEARKQQEAIAELRAMLLAAPQEKPANLQSTDVQAADAGHPFEQAAPSPAQEHGGGTQETETGLDSPVVSVPEHREEQVLQVADVAEPPVIASSEQTEPPAQAPVQHPPFGDSVDVPSLAETFAGNDKLAPAAVMARTASADPQLAAASYLSAARQSLQAAATRSDPEKVGKDFLGFRLLRSLPLPGKQKGQTTSYALLAGIALVAILAIVVGAVELMSRSQPSDSVSLSTVSKSSKPLLTVAKHPAVRVATAPYASGQDRIAILANGGNAQAQLVLGLRELAKENTTAAARWLQRSAMQGVPVAQYHLATLYASGRGVAADKTKAFRWYLAAAQAGNRKAMSNLAVAYAEGDGTPKNPQEAGRWFLKAAQLGLADAQFDLAILYERGLGVPQNLTDAYRWYVIASKSGDRESRDRVDALSSQLTAEDRSAAETAAAEFKPLPVNAQANEPH